MKEQIILNNWYRLKTSPDYGYVKILEFNKKMKRPDGTIFSGVKCLHNTDKDDRFGLIRWFKKTDIKIN